MKPIVNSLIIPVYNNEETLNILLEKITDINNQLSENLEVIFTIDGSPDKSYEILKKILPEKKFFSKVVLLSRNFGSFNAIRAGLEVANGKYFSVMSADMQEPSELIINFFKTLENEPVDVVIGVRDGRKDPFFSKIFSSSYWFFYKKFIIKETPRGGFDVFGCNMLFRNNLLKLKETNSSLLSQILWIGFRRKEILYKRLERKIGTSQWTFNKKINHMTNSIFSFSNLPIKLLITLGTFGTLFFGISSLITIISKFLGLINVQGYTSLFLLIGFIGALNIFGIGLIGSYVWRIYENSKARPLSIISKIDEFNKDSFVDENK